MSDLFARMNELTYGKICQVPSSSVYSKLLAAKNTRIQANKVIVAGLAAAAIAVGAGIAISRTATAQTRVPIIKQQVRQRQLAERIKNARKLLQMSQPETAKFLQMPLRTLQSLEGGEVSTPQQQVYDKYMLLIELADYLRKTLGNRKFAISAAIRTPLSAFEGKTAVKYAEEVEDGAEYVLATVRRMYG